LDEVVKEMKGMEMPKEEPEILIDINTSSYIPDEYIGNKDQKIEAYQNIALCRTREDIEHIIESLTDRYGKMPKEVKSLIDIAEIKEMCKNVGITKISQKQGSIVFNFEPDLFALDIDKLVKKYKNRIKFSSSIKPYMTVKLVEEMNVAQEVKEVLSS
ncbi:MAG: hypothetical protein FWC68_04465, partial [Oscillospiraceae bacterium]|nr:hypothetical protein [Oscillospiraceae bacterium]